MEMLILIKTLMEKPTSYFQFKLSYIQTLLFILKYINAYCRNFGNYGRV